MILFRGKKTEEYGGEWIVSSFILSTPKGVMLGEVDNNIDVASLDIDIVEENIRWYPIQPDTLCQATEFVTYGENPPQPIFDKDIVEYKLYDGTVYRYAIWYFVEGSSFEAIPWSEEDIKNDDAIFVEYPVNFKGNIDWSDFAAMMQDAYGNLKSVKILGNYIDNPELFISASSLPKEIFKIKSGEAF